MKYKNKIKNKPQLWRVVGQDDKLGFAVSQRLQCLSVAEHVLAGFDDQLEPVVNALHGFFLFILFLIAFLVNRNVNK